MLAADGSVSLNRRKVRRMTVEEAIFKYTFEDGTILRLLNVGLSVAEIWKLEDLHGKCKSEVEHRYVDQI